MYLYFILLFHVLFLSPPTANEKIRFDGLYIYDNGIEQVRFRSAAEYENVKSMLDSMGITNTGAPSCLKGKLIDTGSAYIHFIRFFNDSTGIGNDAACREKKYMLSPVNYIVRGHKDSVSDSYYPIACIFNIKRQSQYIRFVKSRLQYFKEVYTGTIYTDSMRLRLQRSMYGGAYTQQRVYKFYSFKQIEDLLDSKTEDNKIYF